MEASCIVVYQFYLNPSATMDGSILYSSLSVLFLSALSSSDFIEILMIWFNFSLWQITVSLIFQFLWIKNILGCYKNILGCYKNILGCYKNTSLHITFFLTLLLKIWTLWIAFLKIILLYFSHIFLIFLIFFLMCSSFSSYFSHICLIFLLYSSCFPHFLHIFFIFLIFFHIFLKL